ncbi:MAG: hypothetical protein IKF56_04515 [Eggerthellaceae bacterium]|nr:hypothetical protein [Eggerthellaceae bacterium]
MKVAMVFKWARDPRDARISVNGELVWGNAKMAASDDDPAAMQVACSLSPEGDITAVTVGDGDNAWAAARGAVSTVIVEGVPDTIDALGTAEAIACAIRSIGRVDAVVVGDSDWNLGVPVALMAQLGITSFAGVVDVEAARGGTWRLFCKEGSIVNVVEARPPFLLAVRGQTAEKEAPGMKQVLAARKKPQVTLTADAPEFADMPKRGGFVEEGAVSLPESVGATMICGDSEEAARDLVAALKRDGVL